MMIENFRFFIDFHNYSCRSQKGDSFVMSASAIDDSSVDLVISGNGGANMDFANISSFLPLR